MITREEVDKIYLSTKLGEHIQKNLGISNTQEFGDKYRTIIDKIILDKKCSIYIGYSINANDIIIIGANIVNEKKIEQQYKFTYKVFLEYK
jgi:hypothetical protein